MSNPLSYEMLTDIEDWATDFVMRIAQGTAEMLQVDGRVYGDVDLDRQQRILAYQAMVRPVQGVSEMDSLRVVNPALAKSYDDQYEKDITATPPYTGKV